jgi:methionine biosynthesis protein MetW
MHKCVERGLTVLQGDIESGLVDYPDQSFDYVILNQIMQEIKKADFVIQESLRVGKWAIVGFPNFAHIKARLTLFLQGKTPINEALPYYWFETPNIRFLTIRDFLDYCRKKNIKIEQEYYLGKSSPVHVLPNLLAQNAVFVITRQH